MTEQAALTLLGGALVITGQLIWYHYKDRRHTRRIKRELGIE